ncbi:MAG TPA: NHL repeat-containing protein [Puia sp.]|nr:NHL repeat-containing protein [Puia sp.]
MNRFTPLPVLLILLSVSCKKSAPYMQPTPQSTNKWTVTTVAGDGVADFADGPVFSSHFHFPEDVLVEGDGSLLVADAGNSRIREIEDGQAYTFAGGSFGFANGNGTNAQFKYPFSLTMDGNGNFYASDVRDPRIRMLTPNTDVSTYAGIDEEGFKDGSINIAQFAEEKRVVSDAAGNLFIADAENNRIRKVSITGTVSTLAGSNDAGFRDGNGADAQFNFPDGIALDQQGNLYVSDAANYRIRKITPDGQVSTVAGSNNFGFTDGDVRAATFNFPADLVIDKTGNLFVIDINRIREVTPGGNVSTIAGGTDGFKDGDGSVAQFNTPDGLGIDGDGNLYVADTDNNRIRKISRN